MFNVHIVILVLDSFQKQGIVFWFFALQYEVGEIANLPLNTVTPNFVFFVLCGTASSFTEKISSSETETKREDILLFSHCSEVNSSCESPPI